MTNLESELDKLKKRAKTLLERRKRSLQQKETGALRAIVSLELAKTPDPRAAVARAEQVINGVERKLRARKK
jgi:hypothetical protein